MSIRPFGMWLMPRYSHRKPEKTTIFGTKFFKTLARFETRLLARLIK